MNSLDAFEELVRAAAGIQDEADAIAAARALVRAAGAILAPSDLKALATFTENAFGL